MGQPEEVTPDDKPIWVPSFEDIVRDAEFLHDDTLDRYVRAYVEYGRPAWEDKIRLVVALWPIYRKRPGNTAYQLSAVTLVGQGSVRNAVALDKVGRLDPVLRGEMPLNTAAKQAGVGHPSRANPKLGEAYGKGDKFDKSALPLLRYLHAWKKRDYKFRHVNPKEAGRRLKVIDEILEKLPEARKDLADRSVRPRHTTPSK